MLVKIDPATGTVSQVASLPGNGFPESGADDAVLDVARHRYSYIYTFNDIRLITVDVQSGAVLANSVLPKGVFDLGLDEASGQLIGHSWASPSSNDLEVDRLDPLTGEITALSTYPAPFVSINADGMVFDRSGTFYGLAPAADVRGAATTLFTIDAKTGAIGTSPLAVSSVLNAAYDSASERIFAVSTRPDFRLVSIDPATGQTAVVAPIAGIEQILISAVAYDPATHRYFFVGGPSEDDSINEWMAGDKIFTIDTETGELLGTSPVVDTLKGIYDLQYGP